MGRSGTAGSEADARVTQHREIERKVRVGEELVLPSFVGPVPAVASVRRGEPVTLVAAYHDTPDLRLVRWGASLRRRTGGPDAGWHLKLPVDGQTPVVRDELALPLDAGEVGQVPAAMADVVRALVREAPLVHVASVRTRRTPWALLDTDGTEVAELVDDRVEVVQGDLVVRSYREIEVEDRLADGVARPELLDGVVAVLVGCGGIPGTQTKVAAALGDRADGAPDVVVPPVTRADDAAADTIRHILAVHVRAFLLADVRVRRDLPDSVHRLRIAARTLRSVLRTFAPLVDASWSTALRTELAWAADEVGTVRDTEVQLARLEEHAARLEPEDRDRATAAVDAWLRDRLDRARSGASAALRSERYQRLLVDLVDAAREPRCTATSAEPAGRVLPGLVTTACRALIAAADPLAPDGPAAQWHRARVLAKRARYAAEAVAPVIGRRARRWGTTLERVTDLLGEAHDAYVAQLVLSEIAADEQVDGPTVAAIGLLDAVEADAERAARERFGAEWPDIRRTLSRHPLH